MTLASFPCQLEVTAISLWRCCWDCVTGTHRGTYNARQVANVQGEKIKEMKREGTPGCHCEALSPAHRVKCISMS